MPLYLLLALVMIFAFCQLADAAPLRALPAGGWETVGLPYAARVSASGNLESLTINGFDFMAPSAQPSHGLFLAVQDVPTAFASAKQDGDTLLLDHEGMWARLRFLPDGIAVTARNLNIRDGNCLRMELSNKIVRAKNPDTGVEHPLPIKLTSYRVRLIAPNGATLTLPGDYVYPAGDALLAKLPNLPILAGEMRYTIGITPALQPEDRLAVTVKTPAEDQTYWDGGPQPLTTELRNMQADTPVNGTLVIALKSYLTKAVVKELRQPFTLAKGGTQTLTWTLDKLDPALYLVETRVESGKAQGSCGTTRLVYHAAGLLPPAPPADFDAFWEQTLAEQAKIPLDLQMTKVKETGKSEVYKFNFAGLLGYRCYGYLTVPLDKTKKYPAVLILPPSGMHGLNPPQPGDDRVAMAININTVDVDLPSEKYDWRTWPAPYLVTGILEKEYYSMRFVYAACARAAEVLAARPEVQADDIMVTGSSQGGGLTLIAAGLYPKFKAAVANVPALCRLDWNFDYLNPPYFPIAATVDTRPMISRTLPYFDPVHFARRINCPTWVSLGLLDDVTPSMGVFCAYNVIKTPKQIQIQPLAAHAGGFDYATAAKGVWP